MAEGRQGLCRLKASHWESRHNFHVKEPLGRDRSLTQASSVCSMYVTLYTKTFNANTNNCMSLHFEF